MSCDFNICAELKVRKKTEENVFAEINISITTVNIFYLEFVNFSLGASGMVRQHLQK